MNDVRGDARSAAEKLRTRQTSNDALERQALESAAALRENEVWLGAQKEAFQTALNGASLETSLGMLIRAAVKQAGADTRCAFYIRR